MRRKNPADPIKEWLTYLSSQRVDVYLIIISCVAIGIQVSVSIWIIYKSHPVYLQYPYLMMSVLAVLLMGFGAGISVYRVTVLRRQIEQLDLLNQISTILTTKLELSDILDEVLPCLRRLFQFDGATVTILKGDSQLQFFPFDELGKKKMSDGVLENQPIEKTATGYVFKTGLPLIRYDLPKEITFEFDSHSIEIGRRSQIFVPMSSKGTTIGVLYIASNQPRQYTSADMSLLKQVATSLAIAIENARLYQLVAQVARTDSLTGLYNRRHFEVYLAEEVARAKRYSRSFSLLLIDIDDFKAINDSFGHDCGDQVLRNVAQVFSKYLREGDVISRWGGDEFAILLPETSLETANIVARRLKQALTNFSPDCFDQPFELGISIGAAAFSKNVPNAEALFRAADKSLYQEKINKKPNARFSSANS